MALMLSRPLAATGGEQADRPVTQNHASPCQQAKQGHQQQRPQNNAPQRFCRASAAS